MIVSGRGVARLAVRASPRVGPRAVTLLRGMIMGMLTGIISEGVEWGPRSLFFIVQISLVTYTLGSVVFYIVLDSAG